MRYLIVFLLFCTPVIADAKLICKATYAQDTPVNSNNSYYVIIKNDRFFEFNFAREKALDSYPVRNGLYGDIYVLETGNINNNFKVVATLSRMTGQLIATYYSNDNKKLYSDIFECEKKNNKF